MAEKSNLAEETDASFKEKLRVNLLLILEKADLNVMTERMIRKQLESEFSCNLGNMKEFIRDEVSRFLQAQIAKSQKSVPEGGVQVEKRRKKPKKEEKEKRPAQGGLSKLCCLSEDLANLFGTAEMPRTQVVKEVWQYIKEHQLQDPENKRRINCDETLEKILGTKSTDMFEMNKLLAKHISAKPVTAVKSVPLGGSPEKPVVKRQKKGSFIFKVDQPLSPALQEFFGTGETELPRQEVVKRLWAYIKEHSLQDPADKRKIICDSKMEKLLEVKQFNGFGITKLLNPHIGKKDEIPKFEKGKKRKVKEVSKETEEDEKIEVKEEEEGEEEAEEEQVEEEDEEEEEPKKEAEEMENESEEEEEVEEEEEEADEDEEVEEEAEEQ